MDLRARKNEGKAYCNHDRRLLGSGLEGCGRQFRPGRNLLLVTLPHVTTVIACILTFVVFAYPETRRIQDPGSSVWILIRSDNTSSQPCMIRFCLLPIILVASLVRFNSSIQGFYYTIEIEPNGAETRKEKKK